MLWAYGHYIFLTLSVWGSIYLFAIHSTHVHMNTFEVIIQIVQYGRLTANRQYNYISSETILKNGITLLCSTVDVRI